MNRDNFEKLQKWENVLNNAVKKSFIHLSTSEFNEIASIYDSIYTPLTRQQRNCNSCRLTALQKLGKDYFAFKAGIGAESEKEKETKKKVGRPKKIDLMAEEE